MLEQYLQEIGLPEKEVKIYMALLGVDQSTVLDLATMPLNLRKA